MMGGQSVTAILLAAGSSTRFGGERNKTLTLLRGEPVLLRSLRILGESPLVDEILVMARPEEQEELSALAGGIGSGPPCTVLPGGATRQLSVLAGLSQARGELILIHDGARPFLRPAFIEACLKALGEVPGATVGIPARDTVKITDARGLVLSTTPRADTWLIQTPQAFHREVLLDCHRRFGADPSVTDDCMLLERGGFPVRVLPGHATNLKITTREDLELAEFYAAGEDAR